MGQLASGVAHDFNNILVVIQGYADLLRLEVEPSESVDESIESISRACEQASGLTRQLLTFSRQGPLDLRSIDLNAHLIAFGRLARPVLRSNVEYRTVLAADLPQIEVDPGQLDQVLLNLTVNARGAIEGSGVLTVSTEAVDIEADDSLAMGEYVRVRFTDTGSGIPADRLDRIFEPFFTTKASGRGTGLGLAIVMGIVRGFGGDVRVVSTVGVGTTFEVLIPVKSTAPAPTIADGPFVNAIGASTMESVSHVLLVDDDVEIRKVLCHFLDTEHRTVLEAASGDEALTLLADADTPIDLVVTDVEMPDGDGLELARIAARDHPTVPLILMSGKVEAGSIAWDPARFLRKPFTRQELEAAIQHCLSN